MEFLLLLLLQIIVILVVSRVAGLLFRKIQQPQVVGDMLAGIMLGPSLLGWLAPGVSSALFPLESLQYLNTLSQIGLVLFMFLVGLELDPKLLRGRGHAAVITSHVSIIAPFFLGTILAYFLYPELSESSVHFTGFTLFMGASMSVTAFPVLARILQERRLLQTRVGAITIACAAVDDVTAWALLAVVIAIVRSSALPIPLWVTLAGSILYIIVMITAVRPALRMIERVYESQGRISQNLMAIIFLLILASAWITESLGIHALFGAFCIGAIMPTGRAFVHELNDKLEHVTVVLLLPLFFANAGLHTNIGLVTGTEMWIFFGLILFVAVAGKFGGSTIAARITGLHWRESAALGVLMNTRGLMELIILSIGLELGVISPALFAMMVMMALLTTFMTTPVLHWLYPVEQMRKMEMHTDEDSQFTVLLAVSLPASGPRLLEMARALIPTDNHTKIYGLHLRRSEALSIGDMPDPENFSQEFVLQPLLERAKQDNVEIHPLVFATDRAGRDIADIAYVKNAQLIVMGWQHPLLSHYMLSGAVHDVMTRSTNDVAVFVKRSFEPNTRILVPFQNTDCTADFNALKAAVCFASNQKIPIAILHFTDDSSTETAEDPALKQYLESTANEISPPVIYFINRKDSTALQQDKFKPTPTDLVVVGLHSSSTLLSSNHTLRHEKFVRQLPSDLLIWRGR